MPAIYKQKKISFVKARSLWEHLLFKMRIFENPFLEIPYSYHHVLGKCKFSNFHSLGGLV